MYQWQCINFNSSISMHQYQTSMSMHQFQCNYLHVEICSKRHIKMIKNQNSQIIQLDWSSVFNLAFWQADHFYGKTLFISVRVETSGHLLFGAFIFLCSLICLQGYFCVSGSTFPQPCPAGTYGNSTGLRRSEDCSPCPGGWYCDGFNNVEPTDVCDPGFYCKEKAYTSVRFSTLFGAGYSL